MASDNSAANVCVVKIRLVFFFFSDGHGVFFVKLLYVRNKIPVSSFKMASIIKPGSVVWAKCGSLFWPAEVLDFQKLPDDIREDFAKGKEPAFTVKFFDEDG